MYAPLQVCLFLLLVVASRARPPPSGFMDYKLHNEISSKIKEEASTNPHHPLEKIQSAIDASTEKIHRPPRQNLQPLSFVNGFVQQTLGSQLKPLLGMQIQPVRHQIMETQSGLSLQQTQDLNSFYEGQNYQNVQMMPQFQTNLGTHFGPTSQFNQGHYQIPAIQLNQGSSILNVGSQLASSIQHIVNSHLESTVQRNMAAHLASLNQNNFQPQPYCPTCSYPIKPNTNIIHQVQAGPPQVAIVSETRIEVICSGENRNCNNVPDKLQHATTETIQHGSEFTPATPARLFPDKPPTKLEGEDTKGNLRPDIVYADAASEQPKLLDTPDHDNIDIRIGNDESSEQPTEERINLHHSLKQFQEAATKTVKDIHGYVHQELTSMAKKQLNNIRQPLVKMIGPIFYLRDRMKFMAENQEPPQEDIGSSLCSNCSEPTSYI